MFSSYCAVEGTRESNLNAISNKTASFFLVLILYFFCKIRIWFSKLFFTPSCFPRIFLKSRKLASILVNCSTAVRRHHDPKWHTFSNKALSQIISNSATSWWPIILIYEARVVIPLQTIMVRKIKKQWNYLGIRFKGA